MGTGSQSEGASLADLAVLWEGWEVLGQGGEVFGVVVGAGAGLSVMYALGW